MSALTIRSATAEDSTAIASVVSESWLDANKNLIPADSKRALTNSRNLAAFVAGEWQSIHVALYDGEIVGTVGINPSGVIWMLYVLPTYQRCGVGSALYDAAIGAIKSTGKRRAMLEVLAANENAVAFYRARGWVPEGRRTEHVPGFRFTALRMGLALA